MANFATLSEPNELMQALPAPFNITFMSEPIPYSPPAYDMVPANRTPDGEHSRVQITIPYLSLEHINKRIKDEEITSNNVIRALRYADVTKQAQDMVPDLDGTAQATPYAPPKWRSLATQAQGVNVAYNASTTPMLMGTVPDDVLLILGSIAYNHDARDESAREEVNNRDTSATEYLNELILYKGLSLVQPHTEYNTNGEVMFATIPLNHAMRDSYIRPEALEGKIRAGTRPTLHKITKIINLLDPWMTSHIQRDIAASITAMVEVVSYKCEITTLDDFYGNERAFGMFIARVYEGSATGSCMTRSTGIGGQVYITSDMDEAQHPCHAYGTKSWAIGTIYNKDTGKYESRTMIDRDNSSYVSMYPSDTTGARGTWVRRLQAFLAKNGMDGNGSFGDGCSMRLIPVIINGHERNGEVLMPYIDAGNEYIVVPNYAGTYGTLEYETDDEGYNSQNTKGYAHLSRNLCCHDCGDHINNDEYNTINDNTICSYCTDNNYVYLERHDVYIHNDDSSYCDECSTHQYVDDVTHDALDSNGRSTAVCDSCASDENFVEVRDQLVHPDNIQLTCPHCDEPILEGEA